MEGYVCVLSTDDYLDGVLVLNQNLIDLNSKYPLLCLINEHISIDTINILNKFNIKYKLINSITYNSNKKMERWNNSFDKLNVFNLTEYNKLIYLDSDLLILNNIDNLFEINRFTMVPDIPFNKEKFNSALMIVIPDNNIYKALIELTDTMNESNTDYVGDQTIINEYYKDKNVITLDKEYNTMKSLHLDNDKYTSYEVTKDVDNPVIIHYINQPKPFMVDYTDKYSDIYKKYLEEVKNKKNA